MRARWLGSIAIAAIIATSSATIARAGDRIVLVAPPPALERAARAQLAPWQIDVAVTADPAPAGLDDARAMATRLDARAVAWITGDSLLVFDVDRGLIATRPAPTPLDDAAAASLALSLKTLLRETWAPPPPIEPDGPVRLSVITGLRVRGAGIEPRVSIAADLQPGAWPIAIGLRGGLGGGVSVHDDHFSGTWVDRSLGVAITVPRLGAQLALEAGGGVSMHLTAIHGVLLPTGGEGRASVINLGVDGEASALWRRPPIAIGARLAATWVPWRQTYSVSDTEVFVVSHLETELGAIVRFTF